MTMEITGNCVAVMPLETGTSKTGKPWQKRNFIAETEEQYPKKICFQLFGERTNECPEPGEKVKVSFDIESREYNGRWYTQISAWKVERPSAAQTASPSGAPAPPAYTQAQPQPPVQPQVGQEQDDSLPF